jgi:hypothetical protein
MTHVFLRSLARLDLVESAVGRYDPDSAGDSPEPSVPEQAAAPDRSAA